jgi:hypothetical protein
MRIIKAAISLLCAVTAMGSKDLRIRRNILDLPRTEVSINLPSSLTFLVNRIDTSSIMAEGAFSGGRLSL